MQLWSVNKALSVGWLLVTAITICSTMLFVPLFSLHNWYGWPLYITIPSGIIIPVTTMILGLHNVAKWWIPWIYLRVTDVVEFQQAAQLSGFLAYPVDAIKDEKKRRQIEARFQNYQFEDDVLVPYETVIYFRRLYQNPFFVIMACGFILSLIPFIMFRSFGPELIIPVFFGAMMFFMIYKTSDQSPQLILSNDGVTLHGTFYQWGHIGHCSIRQGKISRLTIKHNGMDVTIELDNLNIGKRGLNHLLHVYRQRNRNRTTISS